jgi:RecA/RadA recombinase
MSVGTTDRTKQIDELIKAANKKIGSVCVTRGSKIPARRTRHSGIVSLDWALHGGLPIGGMIELTGQPKSFKSTHCFLAAASVQATGGIVALLDIEERFEQQVPLMRSCGVNVEDIIVYKFDRMVDFLAISAQLVKSAKVDLLIIDSIGGMASSKFDDTEFGDKADNVGGNAKLINQFVRVCTSNMAPGNIEDPATYNPTTVILVNHMYDKIGGPPSAFPQYVTSGGRGLKYMTLASVELRRRKQVSEQDEDKYDIGYQTEMTLVTKNITVGPEREANYAIYHTECDCPRGTVGCPKCLDSGWVVYVDNAESLYRLCVAGRMFGPGKDGWVFRDAAAVSFRKGRVIEIGGAGPTAKRFCHENYAYVLGEVFKRQKIRHESFQGYDTGAPDSLLIGGKEVELSGIPEVECDTLDKVAARGGRKKESNDADQDDE